MDRIEFTINGEREWLTQERVVSALRGQSPGRIHVHAVDVNGTYFPVKQALASALQIPKNDFISTRAVELLRKVGFEVIDTDRGPIEQARMPELSHVPSKREDPVRSHALELAVSHLASSPEPVDGAVVLQLAEHFQSWLIESTNRRGVLTDALERTES